MMQKNGIMYNKGKLKQSNKHQEIQVAWTSANVRWYKNGSPIRYGYKDMKAEYVAQILSHEKDKMGS